MKDVDQFAEASGDKVLILSRLFGFPIFELISYAAGLTRISFKRYLTITAIFSLPPSVVFALLFRNIDFTTKMGVLLWFGILIFIGVVFIYLLKRFTFNNNNKGKE